MEKRDELNIKRTKAYALRIQKDERLSKIKGYYKDENLAFVDGKEAGWYGSDGVVDTAENIWKDQHGNIYKVELLGKFIDEEKEHRDKAIANIKSKLSDEEIKLLGL